MEIDALMKRALDFFGMAADREALERLELILERRSEEKYRVAIVGGVSRGKTRLLNRLLDTDVFPESSVPTTTLLTEVVWGKLEEIVFECGETRENLPVKRSSLERFSAEEADADKKGVLKVSWPAPFLQAGIALYDTPGIDDALSSRANVAYNALEWADAALVVIAAGAPVSLLEKSFIETYLENRGIPRIALVIAFLDTFRDDDIASQIRFIAKKAARIDDKIEVWSIQDCGPAARECSICGIESIRARLEAWSCDEDRARQRAQKDLRRCLVLVDSCLARVGATVAALASERQDGEKALLEAYEKLDVQKDEWSRLRGGFLNRAKAVSDALDQRLETLRAEIADAFEREDMEQFRAQLRPRLSRGARELAQLLRERLAKDTEEFQAAIGQKFGIADTSAIAPRTDFALGYALPDLPDQNLGDIFVALVNFARMLWRELGPMLPTPLILRGKAQALVQSALDGLSKCLGLNLGANGAIRENVSDFFITLEQQLKRSVNDLYSETADHAREEQRRWLAGQREMLSELHTSERLQRKMLEMRKLLESGQALRGEIASNLAGRGVRI